MRITLVISSLGCGGAERVMSLLGNHWAQHGVEVTLITLDGTSDDFFPIDDKVHRVGLGLLGPSSSVFDAIASNRARVRELRKAIDASRPDVIISFMDQMNVVTLLATRSLDVPVIVSEHNDPRKKPPGGMIWKVLRKRSYQWADAVVVLTQELHGVLAEFVDTSRLHVIANPAVPIEVDTDKTLEQELPERFIACMGTLCPQKGFDYMLDAFAGCESDGWSVVVLGEGPDRPELEAQRGRLGLDDRFHFIGRVANPHEILARAELFVMSSRFEGFPMALVEAMSLGLPAVSFDCPTGPSDIIEDGVSGILVPPEDVPALSAAIDRALSDADARQRMGHAARRVLDTYSIEKIAGDWESLIGAVRQ